MEIVLKNVHCQLLVKNGWEVNRNEIICWELAVQLFQYRVTNIFFFKIEIPSNKKSFPQDPIICTWEKQHFQRDNNKDNTSVNSKRFLVEFKRLFLVCQNSTCEFECKANLRMSPHCLHLNSLHFRETSEPYKLKPARFALL